MRTDIHPRFRARSSPGFANNILGWILIVAGIAAVGFGIYKAVQAGQRGREAQQIGDRILETYGQRDQSAALRTCVRLAVQGRNCEGEEGAAAAGLPQRSTRAERCGYSDDRCMNSQELAAFSRCMRRSGEELTGT